MRQRLAIFKATLAGLLSIGLWTCQGYEGRQASIKSAAETDAWPSLSRQFACLPPEAAFVAAHRGVSKGEGLAENSASSLKALIDQGILFAEVDVAGLKDGTHILFHDGVWEEKSTGKRAVAASQWSDAETFLLKDTDGKLTADRPIRLLDALTLAKDKLYLEIDFKSSAKYEVVIDAIRVAEMADQVILIAYNDRQAGRLAELAPEMAQSVSIDSPLDLAQLEAVGVARKNMHAWIGRGPYDAAHVAWLKDQGLTLLAWPGRDYVNETAAMAGLIVSDYASGLDPIVGLTADRRAKYLECLSQN